MGSLTAEPRDMQDILILNTLRCEPPSVEFDFLGYGGLPRSVFRMLQSHDDLESVIRDSAGSTKYIPSASSGGTHQHWMRYETRGGISSILANAHNSLSNESDFKMYSRFDYKGLDGNAYTFHFVALEVSRTRGNLHPVWQVGLYITPKGLSATSYEDSLIVELETSKQNVRVIMMGALNSFVAAEKKAADANSLVAPPSLRTILRDHIKEVPKEEFYRERSHWFSYLTGTMEREIWLEVEDHHTDGPPRAYRALLTTSHLLRREHKYQVFAWENNEGVEDPAFRDDSGSFMTHEEAWNYFLDIGNLWIDRIYESARGTPRQFSVALDRSRMEFRYARFTRPDAEGVPILASSWISHFRPDGEKLPPSDRHHYVQFWGASPTSLLRLDEGIHFPSGLKPHSLIDAYDTLAPSLVYGDGSGFAKYLPHLLPLPNVA